MVKIRLHSRWRAMGRHATVGLPKSPWKPQESLLSSVVTSLLDAFREWFEIVPATTPELKQCAFRIRHSVYCEDLGFEPSRPDGLETDQHDGNALHVLMRHRPTDSFIACVRLVRVSVQQPGELLPFEQLCTNVNVGIVPTEPVQRLHIAEVSRLAVVRGFRRRKGEPEQEAPSTDSDYAGAPRQRFPHLLVGLYLGVIGTAALHEIERLFVLTEPRLAGHLRNLGLQVHQIGPPVEHRGVRIPSMIHTASVAHGLRPMIRPFYDHIRHALELAYSGQSPVTLRQHT